MMVATAAPNVVEVEIDDPLNANLFFRPLGRRLRGRFELRRVHHSKGMSLMDQWPDPIPGQRVVLDTESGLAAIVDPLHDADQAMNRKRVERAGKTLAPAREELGPVDVATYVYWLRRAVESGNARVVRGELAATTTSKPQLSFIVLEKPDHDKELTGALARMAAAMEANTKAITALLTRSADK